MAAAARDVQNCAGPGRHPYGRAPGTFMRACTHAHMPSLWTCARYIHARMHSCALAMQSRDVRKSRLVPSCAHPLRSSERSGGTTRVRAADSGQHSSIRPLAPDPPQLPRRAPPPRTLPSPSAPPPAHSHRRHHHATPPPTLSPLRCVCGCATSNSASRAPLTDSQTNSPTRYVSARSSATSSAASGGPAGLAPAQLAPPQSPPVTYM